VTRPASASAPWRPGLTTSEEILAVALARYPADLMPPRARFLVESLFS
jgi:hypothetical protein